CARQDSNLDYW
nr:immunoglobulin heavy chain junction region [Macaca mulatta]MOV48801.1 immunoglobulin heavy chain junction region [Macaca mulatta]MOV49055.1 immunoglobulin heavy chain junction region [Macaca mulatta]MOV49310.1 immunoglobulin heavy chain junction region [Macaca mulatta]MOV49324.1 immunoglobulin heavy chain junction region [Macaca mulatta]